MAIELSWDAAPVYATIVFTVALAGFLLYLDFQKRANRAFALLLLIRAAALVVVSLRNASTTAAEFELFQRMLPYFQLAQVPALLYFVLVYPRPRTWLGRTKWGGWFLLAFALALELLYALDHSLYWTYAPGVASTSILNAGGRAFGGFTYTGFGPLIALSSFSVPMTCVVAALLARDYLRERPGGARFSLVLMISAFVLSGIFFGTQYLVGFARLLAESSSYPWLPWGWAFAALPTLSLPFAAAALGVVWIGSRRTLDRRDDREANRLLLLAPIPMAWALGLSVGATDVFGDDLSIFSLGLWRLLMPVLVTYALLRYHLFDLDVKARLTIHYGSVAAAFGLVFFIGSELAEGFVADALGGAAGEWGGLLAAGLLAFSIRPLERASGRFARRLMPSAIPIEEMDDRQRHSLYRDQFAMALHDGRLSAKERRMLAALQAKLGIQGAPDPASEALAPDRRARSPTKSKADV